MDHERQIEAARIAATRRSAERKVWINLFPDKRTRRSPPRQRMGSGRALPRVGRRTSSRGASCSSWRAYPSRWQMRRFAWRARSCL